MASDIFTAMNEAAGLRGQISAPNMTPLVSAEAMHKRASRILLDSLYASHLATMPSDPLQIRRRKPESPGPLPKCFGQLSALFL